MKPLDIFLSDKEGALPKLVAAIEEKQLVELRRHLHTLKGNAQAFGFETLARYIHAVEWFAQKLDQGVLRVDDQTWNFLMECIHSVQGALQVFRVDPQNPLSLKDKTAEIFNFVRGQLRSNGGESTSSMVDKSNLNQARLSPKPTYTHAILQVKIGEELKSIPCESVDCIVPRGQVDILGWSSNLALVGMDLYRFVGDAHAKWLLVSKNDSFPCLMVDDILNLEAVSN